MKHWLVLVGIIEELLGINTELLGIRRYYRGITRYYRDFGRNDMIYTSGQGYKAYKVDTKGFVPHINKESVSAANLILVPIIKNSHWTLLVGNLKTKIWDFYDSLPKKSHRAILPEVVSSILKIIKRNYNVILLKSWHLQISHLYEDTTNSFDTDIRGWPIQKIKQAPTQKNSVDCGMYVCKYMKAAIQPEAVVWGDVKNWQENMAKFRAEFTYAILTTIIK
ncbi:hypothetical protein IEQ34_020562 [Dendrobium chrysotoxum]|uniref:Ubiquitin-like protease family profile domain-containing protein n=1 Tax=Dendrobium chrysotoxum TaxID=161865 RepID=A0AAV7G2B9_DENCH|nr:hypothetical protein IEQ34_020562 [Dendrobium chrysotoxum]